VPGYSYNWEEEFAMVIEIPDELEVALKVQANAHGVSPAGYVREALERELAPALAPRAAVVPFKTSFGILVKYGPAPTAEEIDENRKDMFRTFGEDF
jgi:plasmid stability protein